VKNYTYYALKFTWVVGLSVTTFGNWYVSSCIVFAILFSRLLCI